MKILKRLILIIGFLPIFILLTLRWVITGKDIDDSHTRFIKWCNK